MIDMIRSCYIYITAYDIIMIVIHAYSIGVVSSFVPLIVALVVITVITINITAIAIIHAI